jgi:hypothetical protein
LKELNFMETTYGWIRVLFPEASHSQHSRSPKRGPFLAG